MAFYKQFENGLKLVGTEIEGLMSVSLGVIVKTGSVNESQEENGISHFIEHVMFKGTKKRSAFEISDTIDSMGAQINAFTSKELTCYYTKSTAEHLRESAEVLSDIFFNSVFDESELEKEKGVIIEEINMSEDTPEDVCLDLLAKSYYGETGLGRTILGPAKNIKRFTKKDVLAYMDKYYTADNVVIAIAGNVSREQAEDIVREYFVDNFTRLKSKPQFKSETRRTDNLYKSKKIEQAHIAISMPAIEIGNDRSDALIVANTVLGGGMSSRLFQKVREELGLCYSVYSYLSQYKDSGVIEIYGGVNTDLRDLAYNAIIDEVKKFKEKGISEQEFLRGKEQLKSAFIMSRESTASQMLLYGKNAIYLDKLLDVDKRLSELNKLSLKDVQQVITDYFDLSKSAIATVGPSKKPIKR